MRFSKSRWTALGSELGRRGRGNRESGAFLLAKPERTTPFIERLVFFDDIDPACLQGHIALDGRAYSKLWDICEAHGVVVVGDVHTHGGPFVQQSPIDAANPMVARTGHIALIFPHLATRPLRPSEIGVHRYRGDDGWESWFGTEAAERVPVRWWR